MENGNSTNKFNEPCNSVGVYCKCGGVIIASDYEGYKKSKSIQKEINDAFDEGYTIGRMPDQFVRDNFGCKCKTRTIEKPVKNSQEGKG